MVRSKVKNVATIDCEKADSRSICSGSVEGPSILVIFVAEVLGTGLLMFFGCMGVCLSNLIDMDVLPHFGSLTFGLTVLIVIQMIGHVSGAHLNPQVTIAAFILGKLKLVMVPIYFLAEFIGALLGFLILKVVTPAKYTKDVCGTIPHQDLTVLQAVAIETIITAVLILICGAVWDRRNADKQDSIPIRFGFIIACISIVAGPFTGASMNTARSFAPSLVNSDWTYHWVYWVGPTAGALIGSFFYKYVLDN